MLIYFVRHGETDWNQLKKHQGAEFNGSLNANGRNQAKLTGQYLQKHGRKYNQSLETKQHKQNQV